MIRFRSSSPDGAANGRTLAHYNLSRRDRERRRWPWQWDIAPLVAAGLVVFAIAAYDVSRHPWSLQTNLRHALAIKHCDLARMVGLAPSRQGMPGYHPSRDADLDGIACEPYGRWR